MKISAVKLCKLYQQNGGASHRANRGVERELLFDIASQLDEIAMSMPNFDEDDHGAGKDAGIFHHAYIRACQGEVGYLPSGRTTPEEYLMWEIDTLLAGCHADASVADCYIDGGTELLDAIFEWDGKGSLYDYYHRR